MQLSIQYSHIVFPCVLHGTNGNRNLRSWHCHTHSVYLYGGFDKVCTNGENLSTIELLNLIFFFFFLVFFFRLSCFVECTSFESLRFYGDDIVNCGLIWINWDNVMQMRKMIRVKLKENCFFFRRLKCITGNRGWNEYFQKVFRRWEIILFMSNNTV